MAQPPASAGPGERGLVSYRIRDPAGAAGNFWKNRSRVGNFLQIDILQKSHGRPSDDPRNLQAGLEQPVYYWDPVISPSGMTFYDSDSIPEWKNNLFIGALSGTHIVRLVIDNNKVVGEERLLSGEGQRFRDVKQGRDGALYAVTDGGRLYRIAKK